MLKGTQESVLDEISRVRFVPRQTPRDIVDGTQVRQGFALEPRTEVASHAITSTQPYATSELPPNDPAGTFRSLQVLEHVEET